MPPVHLAFDSFELDEANARLLKAGVAVALAPTPFNLLCALARQPGMLLSKDALLDAVWGHRFVSESVLKTAVSDLRIALGDSPREPRFIETVPRRGYRFIGLPAVAAPAVARPPDLRAAPQFVGREEALARLSRHWAAACGGQRAVVWVAGEPGIGKTALIERLASGLEGARVARGQCVEHYGTGEPYLPVLEALAELCRQDDTLPGLLRTVAPTWLLQLPWLGSAEEREVLRRELTGVGPERMLREMSELLDRYTAERSLLLVTEDLHWSDRATLQLIDHVARRRGPARLMWLASLRIAEVVAGDHPLKALRRELRLQRLCDEIVLDPFSETEVAAYLALRSPALARDEAVVRALHEKSDGVPLFVSSLVAEVMDDSQADAAQVGRHLAALAVPDNLAAIIDHHIAGLAEADRAVLAAAAVCGTEFRVDTLAAATGRDLADVALSCDALVRGQLWLAATSTHGADYSFKHALFRQVLYERTPPSARVQLHRAVAQALEAERAAGLAVPAAELALHCERSRQPLAALRRYAEAAQAALGHFSPADALGLAERGLALLPQAAHDVERDGLELTLTTLQGLAAFQFHGVTDAALSMLQRAQALLVNAPRHPLRTRLLHGLGYLSCLRADYVEALVAAKRAEALAAESQDAELLLVACVLHGEIHHQQGRTEAARDWLERGLALAGGMESAGSDGVFAADPQATLLGLLAIDLVRCGLLQQGRGLLERSRKRAARLRQPMTRLVVAWHEALCEVRLGNGERVAVLAAEMAALADEFALPHSSTAADCFRGWAEARCGQPGAGYERICAAYASQLQHGLRVGSSEVLGYAAEALLAAGEVDGAEARLREALKAAEDFGEGVYLPQLRMLQAAVARVRGQATAEETALRAGVAEARAQGATWLELQAWLALCERPDATVDDRRVLTALVDSLPEMAGTSAVARALALG